MLIYGDIDMEVFYFVASLFLAAATIINANTASGGLDS